jgi:uncharacterized protein
MKTILITGANGTIGKNLSVYLSNKGLKIVQLVRNKNASSPFKQFVWNVEQMYIEPHALENVDIIIHLAGAGIADKPWTKKRKQEILHSRVSSTSLLIKALQEKNKQVELFIGASAIGYYGAITGQHIFTETDLPAPDFLGTTCKLWEESAWPLQSLTQRMATLRIGIVLAKEGGAFSKLSGPVKAGFGATLGSGSQYFPWIHLDDLCKLFYFIICNTNAKGVYNAVSTEHTSNMEFTKRVAAHVSKKLWLPCVPSFLLKMILGEMADTITNGSRVSSQKIISEGFVFDFPHLNDALPNLLNTAKNK